MVKNTYKSREVIRALTQKGFHQKEGDHHRFRFYQNGKKTNIQTKVSHTRTAEVTSSLLKLMSIQMHIDISFLQEYLDCKKTEKDYISELLKHFPQLLE